MSDSQSIQVDASPATQVATASIPVETDVRFDSLDLLETEIARFTKLLQFRSSEHADHSA